MAEQDLDRNEAATPYKLQKARERGQVSKSPDVVSAAVFAAAAVFFAWHGETLLSTHFRFDQDLLIQAARLDPLGSTLWPLVRSCLIAAMNLLAPFFGALMLAAIVGNVMQTGPVLSTEPLKADWQRLNPKNAIERLFSVRILFDGARACLKLLVLGSVAYLALRAVLPHFYSLASMSPSGFVKNLMSDLSRLLLQFALALGIIAALDLLYTRHEFSKKMRMSRRELKDEHKHREGDPRIRARMRELRREMLKKSLAARNTRNADVVVTNPTHVAVALRYSQSEMSSPEVVAKGTGKIAAVIREVAARHRIPVVQNPPLARRLYRELQINQFVPAPMYADVARIIVWVFAMRQRQAQPSRSPA